VRVQTKITAVWTRRTENQYCRPHADQHHAEEDRAVQRIDQLLVEVGPRPPGQPLKNSAQQQLDELGQGQRGRRDDQRQNRGVPQTFWHQGEQRFHDRDPMR
jgi:hypothetical protein